MLEHRVCLRDRLAFRWGSKSRGLTVSRGARDGLGLLPPWRRTRVMGLYHSPSDPLRVREL